MTSMSLEFHEESVIEAWETFSKEGENDVVEAYRPCHEMSLTLVELAWECSFALENDDWDTVRKLTKKIKLYDAED